MKLWAQTIGDVILWVIATILLFLLASTIYVEVSGSSDGFFGIGYAVISSPSMENALSKDDGIVYMAHKKEDYKVGDIITYNRKDLGKSETITHRIIKIDGDTLVTKGDANKEEDPEITFSDVRGRLVFSVPYLGIVITFLKTLPGKITCGALYLLLLIAAICLGRSGKNKTVGSTAK